MFKNIGEAIETKLNALKNTTTLNQVFNYEIKASEWFPYATIVPSPSDESILDNTTDEINVGYLVKIFDETSDDISQTEANMRKLVDDIAEAFRKDYTLGGLSKSLSINYDWGTTDDEIPRRYAEMTFNYTIIKSILP